MKRLLPYEIFESAWTRHKARQRILPPNEQDFRHGWNAALVAAAQAADGIERTIDIGTNAADIPDAIRALEVEVQT